MDNYSQLELPTAGTSSLIYIVFMGLAAVYFSRKSGKFWLLFPIIFWLLGQPVLHAYYTIRPAWLPFDFQPNRLLFLYLLVLLPVLQLSAKGGISLQSGEKKSPSFEKYIGIFVLLVVVAVVLNRHVLDIKRVVAIPLEPITFLLLYVIFKKIVTENILWTVLHVLVFMAFVNGVIALLQLVDPLFLRTGILRSAYGGLYRSYGVFSSEYILGSFQIVALFITLTAIKSKYIKNLIVSILVMSIVVTFHRMDLIILMFCGLFYLYRFVSRRAGNLGLIGMIFVSVVVFPAYSIFQSVGGESQLVNERLSKNTISGRLDQFDIVIKAMPRHPLGLGSEENPVYQELMIKHGHTKSELRPDGRYYDVGLPVHNGFLSVGIMYGIIAMVVFVILLFKMVRYFYSHANKQHAITVIPLISLLVWALANLSNGLVVFRAYNVLTVAVLIGLFTGAYIKGILGVKNA